MKINKNKIFLGLVLAFYLLTRLYKISEIPASVYWDEASIGYNAYSVSIDLKDEWGNFLPLHFRAFGEFKLPVYIYSVIPFVKIFGLNALSVRIPAVLFSFGTLIIVYLLTKRITGKEEAGILAAFILSVSPWLFIFSRTGYEATAGLFLFLTAIYVFILNKNSRIFYLLGVFLLIGSMYSYTSFRLLALPVIVVFSFIRLKDGLKRNLLALLLSFLIVSAALIPIARLFIYDAGFGRAQTFSLIPGFKQVYDLSGKPHFQVTFNRNGQTSWIKNGETIVLNYFSHFSPKFLLMIGDLNSRSQIPNHGEIYILDLILAIVGVIAIFKKRKLYFLPLILLLIAPIPASLTKESPHALRSVLAAPSFAIIASLGAFYILEKYKKYKTVILITIIAGYYFSFRSYDFDFVTKYQNLSATDWQYQYKEIFSKQDSGVVTDKYGQPYIFALFYLKYPPQKFRQEVKYNPVDNWGFSLVESFNGFEFRDK